MGANIDSRLFGIGFNAPVEYGAIETPLTTPDYIDNWAFDFNFMEMPSVEEEMARITMDAQEDFVPSEWYAHTKTTESKTAVNENMGVLMVALLGVVVLVIAVKD